MASPDDRSQFPITGDHVHLYSSVQGTRQTTPAVELDDLPLVDIFGSSFQTQTPIPALAFASPNARETRRRRPTHEVNEVHGAVPQTNGWMLKIGHTPPSTPSSFNSSADLGSFKCGCRIYISGNTPYICDLEKIRDMYMDEGKPDRVVLIYLGGTTIPGPRMPLIMATLDAKQGI